MEYNEKQVRIMEEAELLFAEKGFAGTSVRDIAEAAQVNLAMISYYFGSKEKLMESMFAYRGAYMKLQLQSILEDKHLTSMQKVEKLIDQYIDRIIQKQCFHKIIVREQMANHSGPITEQITQLKRTNQELITRMIQEGQKKGEFKKNVEIPFLMLTLVGTTSQLVTTPYYYRELNNLQSLSVEDFQKHMKKKLSAYLKMLFKALLTYEG
jgi:AcrR family transcriptional regulator